MTSASNFLLIFILVNYLFISCNFSSDGNKKKRSNEVIIFHAGSLTVPIHEIARAYEQDNPGTKILLEAAGSRECARKITELKRPCDIIAVADYKVIESLLMPEYADWLIQFAGNSMCIALTEKSRLRDRINEENWYEILLNDSVFYGRSDPNSDPCGYRTIHTIKLAENYYETDGLTNKMLAKDQRFMRPKETDLLPLLESHAIDYIFIYLSVALQHNLHYLILPPEINLANPDYDSLYATVSVELSGKTPGEIIVQKGESMLYGLSIPFNSPNETDAIKFLEFFLHPEKGLKILEKNGQPVFSPPLPNNPDRIPDRIIEQINLKRI